MKLIITWSAFTHKNWMITLSDVDNQPRYFPTRKDAVNCLNEYNDEISVLRMELVRLRAELDE